MSNEGKDKRVASKRALFDASSGSAKFESRLGLWTDEHLTKLIDHLKENGFDGDYLVLHKLFPNFSENTIKGFFGQLSRWSEPQKEDPVSPRKRGGLPPAPIEEWITPIRDSIEVQRLGGNPALILEWIAKFEEHPDPADSCGVDYKAIYLYISALLEGHIPKQLNPPTASKLIMMFQQLKTSINQTAPTSQKLLLQSAKKIQITSRLQREEKNKLLRERRRTVWTEEELEQARIVKTGDLEQIKKLICEKPGLNPFCFPPDL